MRWLFYLMLTAFTFSANAAAADRIGVAGFVPAAFPSKAQIAIAVVAGNKQLWTSAQHKTYASVTGNKFGVMIDVPGKASAITRICVSGHPANEAGKYWHCVENPRFNKGVATVSIK